MSSSPPSSASRFSGAFDAAGAQVLLRGASAPVPLGSLGEGVSRILALAIHLVSAPGGIVLVDEIRERAALVGHAHRLAVSR